MATFRQTTSRADDPQIHTHAVISAKVQTPDGRWYALDARYLKRHQRMLGGLYQSVLRAELTHRFGVEWRPIVNGQAEIAGVPDELLDVFSKRSADIDAALAAKLDEFRHREGRDPSRWERAALTREASADTRSRKSGHGAADLATRWRAEADDVGWSVDRLDDAIERGGARAPAPTDGLTVDDVVDAVSAQRSSWGRPDVLQAICDVQRPVSSMSGHRWARRPRTCRRPCARPAASTSTRPATRTRRRSDGRSVWIEPTAPRFTSEAVLAQEEAIITWAMAAQADPPAPSTTVDRTGLDVLQADAAAAVAGDDRLVLVVGPAGAGKTRMLAAAATDLHAARPGRVRRRTDGEGGPHPRTRHRDPLRHRRQAAPRMAPHRPATPRRVPAPAGATLIVDEAGMLSTPALHQLVTLADSNGWRLALVGDPRQLQGVGRGGLLAELCANGRVEQLERLHRFTHHWEAAASLQLRCGDPGAFDAYEAHGRIIPGTLDEHLARMADTWIDQPRRGPSSRPRGVDQRPRRHHQPRRPTSPARRRPPRPRLGDARSPAATTPTSATSWRPAATTAASPPRTGEPVRNRELWTVTATNTDGSLTVSHHGGHGPVTLPADYVREHTSGSATPPPSTAGSPTPSTPPSRSPHRPPPAAACTSPPPGPRREPDLRRHRQRRRRRGPRRPRRHRRPRPRRHPRRHPTAHPRPADAAPTGRRHARLAEMRDPGVVSADARRRPSPACTARAARG